jgi:mannose-1-phosphate guanylyltransferase
LSGGVGTQTDGREASAADKEILVDVQAVILAGGKGTRLRPVTMQLPKPLVPIANTPLVLHQLRHLADSGVRDVTLALGYNAEQFADVEADAADLGINLRLITEPAPMGTGGALRYCADQGAFDDRPLLWMNGDVVASPSVESLAEFSRVRESALTLWLTSARDVSQFGVLELNNEGHVDRFLEKPAPEETDSHLVNAGILLLDPKLLDRIPPDTFFSFEKQLLPQMVKEREAVYGMFDGGYWMDTGRPRLYLAANRAVLEGRVDWRPREEQVEDGVWEGTDVERKTVGVIHPAVLGDRVHLEEGAQLFGRTILGADCTVRSGAQLENCVLFDDVEIGHDVEVINSIVCSGARIGNGTVLHNAIVGARAVVGRNNELRKARLWNDVEIGDRQLVVDP